MPSPRLSICRRCPRLAKHLAAVRAKYPEYHARPVAAFGDPAAHLLIVGLAPGLHGANATGRPFTGDHAGILLYRTLHAFGFADRAQSLHRDDGLTLHDCRITNAVKCLPPENKPSTAEIKTCNDFLRTELMELPPGGVIAALGSVAHQAVLRALQCKAKDYPFKHGAVHELADERYLLDSYHCSRYNTQTGRLTEEMFRAVFATARKFLEIGFQKKI